MNTLEAVKLRIGLTDNEQDGLITELISDARARVLAYINQDGGIRQDVPTSLDYIIKEISVRMYNAIGDEGKKSSSEGEISNTWNVIDLSEYADALDVYRDNFKRRRPGMRFV